MPVYISRLVIRNFRNFDTLDVSFEKGATCVVGENNTGKSNLFYAIRLAVDCNLSWGARRLAEGDVYCGTSLSSANQVLVAVEFKGWTERDNERALVNAWQITEGVARLTYRFRPKQSVRDDIAGEVRRDENLGADDYDAEVTGGGGEDPLTVEWNDDIGHAIRFGDLQAFQVVCLPALRDVEQDLRSSRISPLSKLISASDIPAEEKAKLVEILRQANDDISEQETFKNVGSAIDSAFLETAGKAFALSVKLGMSDPSFTAITKSLTVLLSNGSLSDFEPSRNGLGLNNMLYISMLMEYFQKRLEAEKAAGELLLIEEPEAHLHPQLQRTLYSVLAKKDFQTIITTHSTHITSESPLRSMVVLTNTGGAASSACVPAVVDMERDMQQHHTDLDNLTVEELGLFACPEKNLKLLTMHSSKGREFDAVALIDLHERKIPSGYAETDEEIEEQKRLLYVATTRTKKVLLFVTDSEKHWHRPSRFLVNDLKLC